MDEIKKVIRVSLIIVALGMFLAGIYYAVQASLPAILYLIAGLVLWGIERLIELSGDS